jgi:hypothetical protein
MLEKLRKLFVSCNPFDEPFQPSVERRLLLYPTDGYILTEQQFKALRSAAASLGDTTGYCIITERIHDLSDNNIDLICYKIDLHDYGSYRKLSYSAPIVEENALISDRAEWAVLFSTELHALVGGPKSFIEEFVRLYPEVDKEFDEFVKAWEADAERIGYDISWLPKLAAHLHRNLGL